MVEKRGASTCSQLSNLRYQAVFSASSVLYFVRSHCRKRPWLPGQKQNSGCASQEKSAQLMTCGSLQTSQPYNDPERLASRDKASRNVTISRRTPPWSMQYPGADCEVTIAPLRSTNRPSGKRCPT